MICIDASGATAGGNNKGIVALNGVNGAVPLEGVGPAPELYDHHSIAQEAAGYANLNRPYTNSEWTSGVLKYQGNNVGYTDQWDINNAASRALVGPNYTTANSAIDFGAFRNGLYTLVNNYTIAPGTTSNEGVTVTFSNLNTLSIPNGRTVYWTVDTITGAAANLSPSQGTLLVTAANLAYLPGTMPNFSITTALDNTTEGNGSYYVNFHQGGYSGVVFATIGPININDISKYPYFGTYATNVNEGASLSLPVIGYDISAATTYYWTIDTNAAQFAVASGTVVITSNAGSFSVTPIADNTSEGGTTTFTVSLRIVNTTGPIIATTSPITINDTSKYPRFGTVPTSIDEGSAGTFNVVADNIGSPGVTYYWRISRNSGRFPVTSGSVVITNNAGSFTVTPEANLTTNSLALGASDFTVSLLLPPGGLIGTAIATTGAITINDTSQTPAFTSPSGAASINEGSAQSFSVSGYTAGANVTIYWYINHITTIAADFSGGVTDGSFTLNNGGSFSITSIADNLSEGTLSGNKINPRDETFTVSIARTSLGTAVATSPTITISDTSLRPLNTIYWTYSSNPGCIPGSINLDTLSSQGAATFSGGPYVVGRTGNTFNVIVNAGIVMRGRQRSGVVPGLRISGGSAVNGDVLIVTVNGTVHGAGGFGGTSAGTAGQAALDVSAIGMTSLTLNGSGYLAGGGGGGGGSTGATGYAGGGYGAGCECTPWNTKGGNGSFTSPGQYSAGKGGAILSATNTPYGAGEAGYACAGVAIGGNQGGGGGRRWCFTGSFCGRALGGRGGVGTGAGGNAPNTATCPGGARRSVYNGGGGGGWGAAGGSGGSFYTNNIGGAGGAGGKAVNSASKTISGSVANQWGSVG